MSAITTHILDTSRGLPAQNVTAVLEFFENDAWRRVGGGKTDDDGRIKGLVDEGFSLQPGHYRLDFAVGAYFDGLEKKSFYPYVQIVFQIEDTDSHYHVPLLLNPFGYSTYRGS